MGSVIILLAADQILLHNASFEHSSIIIFVLFLKLCLLLKYIYGLKEHAHTSYFIEAQ